VRARRQRFEYLRAVNERGGAAARLFVGGGGQLDRRAVHRTALRRLRLGRALGLQRRRTLLGAIGSFLGCSAAH
jgi:hypothetical protein